MQSAFTIKFTFSDAVCPFSNAQTPIQYQEFIIMSSVSNQCDLLVFQDKKKQLSIEHLCLILWRYKNKYIFITPFRKVKLQENLIATRLGQR